MKRQAENSILSSSKNDNEASTHSKWFNQSSVYDKLGRPNYIAKRCMHIHSFCVDNKIVSEQRLNPSHEKVDYTRRLADENEYNCGGCKIKVRQVELFYCKICGYLFCSNCFRVDDYPILCLSCVKDEEKEEEDDETGSDEQNEIINCYLCGKILPKLDDVLNTYENPLCKDCFTFDVYNRPNERSEQDEEEEEEEEETDEPVKCSRCQNELPRNTYLCNECFKDDCDSEVLSPVCMDEPFCSRCGSKELYETSSSGDSCFNCFVKENTGDIPLLVADRKENIIKSNKFVDLTREGYYSVVHRDNASQIVVSDDDDDSVNEECTQLSAVVTDDLEMTYVSYSYDASSENEDEFNQMRDHVIYVRDDEIQSHIDALIESREELSNYHVQQLSNFVKSFIDAL